jgi:hypothetical protein
LPPSSSTTFFLPALALSAQPTSGEPVKLSSLSRSSVVNRSAPSRRHGRIEKAPGGRSVSASTSPMISAPIGVRLAGLSTNGQPTAIAGAILWAARLSGKLNGLMNEQGRSARASTCRGSPWRAGEMSSGRTSPSMRTDSSAAMRKVSISRVTSPRLSGSACRPRCTAPGQLVEARSGKRRDAVLEHRLRS